MKTILALAASLVLLQGSTESPTARSAGPRRLDPTTCAVLVIDVQPSFVRTASGDMEPVMSRLEQLLLFADVWALPVVVTLEHSVERKGPLHERLAATLPQGAVTLVKRRFDALAEPDIAAAVKKTGKRQIVVAGCETDVCVLQSVLGLLAEGYEVFLLEDAVFSHEANVGPALRRMEAAGAVPTTFKAFFFEAERGVRPIGTDAAWELRYQRLRDRIRDPYSLPAFAPR
jgi:nicotinamidase-related amidase